MKTHPYQKLKRFLSLMRLGVSELAKYPELIPVTLLSLMLWLTVAIVATILLVSCAIHPT